jgi:tetratricopeptide (TPR) repeat protein
MRSLLVLLTVVVGLTAAALGTGGTAHAQLSDDERARLHFESGRSYYEQARYDDAAREFQEAFKLSGRPALLLNLSQAYERALRFDEAIMEAQHYLQLVPDAPDRRTQEERIGRLDQLRSRVQPIPGQQPAPAPAQPAPTWPAQPAPATAAPLAPTPAAPPAAAPAEDSGNPLAVPGFIRWSAR